MIYYTVFTAILFLFILNGFLRGRLKPYTDMVLTIAMLTTVIIGSYSEGWKTLIYFAMIWLIGGNLILTPLAKMAARKLLP